MSDIHICEPLDTTRTLCGQAAARVAAVNYSEFPIARGPFCAICEPAAKACMAEEEALWALEEAGP